jgi:hypothetical protein
MTRQEKIMSIAKCEVHVAYLAEMMVQPLEMEFHKEVCGDLKSHSEAVVWLEGEHDDENEAELGYLRVLGCGAYFVQNILYMGGAMVNPHLVKQDLYITQLVNNARMERWVS